MSSDATEVVRRMRHETDDQYADRVRVYKRYVLKYGAEEAEMLSMVYSNMKFMHCRYPPEIEAKLHDCDDLRGVFAGAVESRAVRVLKKAAEEKASATKGAAAAPAKE